ncbi:uncharacterized protein AMSG_02420 [Thecamonas trahens ATCC 50062]|uniref:ERAP1-like C-terminal domain-containing protein n=1 Tax=Thecamonas trahens ATCC 50062 TaxID=461836 RepID=A0A0L0DW56_THETB|nr:hypothetical protein AMSG_02420 [Thecamonas trahens ATCC 50062]KNC56450.1 hypothetical protein AMSG_02420 [Thecamonas trahens ATCC 50062]|eukprot:XP_013760962.1 hypothetical protein AMSG_02420 [Thecamonas trahens ATCC 50062]
MGKVMATEAVVGLATTASAWALAPSKYAVWLDLSSRLPTRYSGHIQIEADAIAHPKVKPMPKPMPTPTTDAAAANSPASSSATHVPSSSFPAARHAGSLASSSYASRSLIDAVVLRAAEHIKLGDVSVDSASSGSGLVPSAIQRVTSLPRHPHPPQVDGLEFDADAAAGMVFFVLHFEPPLRPGPLLLRIAFSGAMARSGIVRPGLVAPGSANARTLSLALLAPGDGGAVWPVVGIRGARCKTLLSLVVPAAQRALASSPCAASQELDASSGSGSVVADRVRHVFRLSRTGPETSYGFAAGSFDSRIAFSDAGYALGIHVAYAPDAATGVGHDGAPSAAAAAATLAMTSFALDTLSAALSAIEDVLDAPLPMDKYDIVIVPDGVALPNAAPLLALAFTTAANIVFDPALHPPSQLRHVASYIVATVIDSILCVAASPLPDACAPWLGAGLRKWLADKVLALLFPSWNVAALTTTARFATLHHPLATRLPLRSTMSRAITQAILPWQSGHMAGIAAMVFAWIGSGPRTAFYRSWATLNASYSDTTLLALLQRHAAKPLDVVLAPWFEAAGVPSVHVTSRSDSDGIDSGSGSDASAVDSEYDDNDDANALFLQLEVSQAGAVQYWIPLFLMQPGASRVRVKVFAHGQVTVHIQTGAWIAVNWLRSGHYSVVYSGPVLRSLRDAAVSHALGAPSRAALVYNVGAAVLQRALPLTNYLDLIQAVGTDDEDAVEVWLELVASFDAIFIAVRTCRIPASPAGSAALALLTTAGRKVFRSALRLTGWDRVASEALAMTSLRTDVIRLLAVVLVDPEIQTRAVTKFNSAVVHRELARSHLALPLAQAAVQATGKDAFETVLEVYREAPSTRRRLLGALGTAVSPLLISRALDLVLHSTMPVEGCACILTSALATETGAHKTLAFLADNLGAVHSRFVAAHAHTLWLDVLAALVAGYGPPSDTPAADVPAALVDATELLRELLVDAVPGAWQVVAALLDSEPSK